MSEKCPTCGSPVEIKGHTTHYYVSENEELKKRLFAVLNQLKVAREALEFSDSLIERQWHPKVKAQPGSDVYWECVLRGVQNKLREALASLDKPRTPVVDTVREG